MWVNINRAQAFYSINIQKSAVSAKLNLVAEGGKYDAGRAASGGGGVRVWRPGRIMRHLVGDEGDA
jgi:hypothetical protein